MLIEAPPHTASTITSRRRQQQQLEQYPAIAPRAHAEPLRAATPSQGTRVHNTGPRGSPPMRGSASAPVLPTLSARARTPESPPTQWQHHGHARWQYEHERSMLRTREPQPFRPRPAGRHRPPTADLEERPETAPAPQRHHAQRHAEDSRRSSVRSSSVPTARRPSWRDSMDVSIDASAATVAREECERPQAVLVDDEKIFSPLPRARLRTLLARDVLWMATLSQKLSLKHEVSLAPKPKMKLGGGGLSRLRGGLSGSLEKMKEERRAAAAAEFRQARTDALAAFAERKHAVAVERLGRCVELAPSDDALRRMRARALALDGHAADALEEANAAVALNQREAANFMWHGRCNHMLRSLPEAGASYLTAMRNGRNAADVVGDAGYAGFLDDVRRQRSCGEAAAALPLLPVGVGDKPPSGQRTGTRTNGRFVSIFDDAKVLEGGDDGGGGGGAATGRPEGKGCKLLAPRLWCSRVDDAGAEAHWMPAGMPVNGEERRDSIHEDVSAYCLQAARHTTAWRPETKSFVEEWAEFEAVHEGSARRWSGPLAQGARYRLRVRAFDLLYRASPWSDVVEIKTPSTRELNDAAAAADSDPANAVLPRAWLGCDVSDIVLEYVQDSVMETRGADELADGFVEDVALALAPRVPDLRRVFRLYACGQVGSSKGLGKLQFARMCRECGLAKGLPPRGAGRAPLPGGAAYTPLAPISTGELDLIYQRANLDASELSTRRSSSPQLNSADLTAKLPAIATAVHARLFSGEAAAAGDAAGMPAPAARLHVSDIRAYDVPDADAKAGSGYSDPYVTVALLGVEPPQTLRTATVDNESNPVWDEQLTLELERGGPRPPRLRVGVFDDDANNEDDPIGTACVEVDGALFDEQNWGAEQQVRVTLVPDAASAAVTKGTHEAAPRRRSHVSQQAAAAATAAAGDAGRPTTLTLSLRVDSEFAAQQKFDESTDGFMHARPRDARTGEADGDDGGRELMTLTEWVGGLVRLAWVVFPQLDDGHRIGGRLSAFIEEVLLPTADAEAAATQTEDAYDRADAAKVRAIFEHYDKELRKIFDSYAAADQLSADARASTGSLNLGELTFLAKDGKLFDAAFTFAGLNAVFVRVNSGPADGHADGDDDDEQELVYDEFLEALGRICCAKLGLGDGSEMLEPFELSLQSWLGLYFVPTSKRILKDKAKGVLKKTL